MKVAGQELYEPLHGPTVPRQNRIRSGGRATGPLISSSCAGACPWAVCVPAPTMGTAKEPQDQGHYQFDQVTAADGEFTLDNLAWHSCHSSYL
jgi:hypothetical protein